MRAIKYLIIGICALALTFCSVVLIWAGVSGKTFTSVIQSWSAVSSEETTAKTAKRVSATSCSAAVMNSTIQYSGVLETNVAGVTIPVEVQFASGTTYIVRLSFADDQGDLISGWIVYTSFPEECSETSAYTESSDNFVDDANNHYVLYFATQNLFDFDMISEYVSIFFSSPLPADPVKEGYDFTGWYTDEACTQKYTDTTVTGDVTLYAGWAIKRFTVKFDTAGGTAVTAAVIDWNTAVTPGATSREGHNFLGWFLADGTAYTGQTLKANTTITARWEIKMFTVKFVVDGAEYASVTVPWGTSFGAAIDRVAAYNSLVGAKIDGKALTDYNTSSAIIGEGLTLEMETGAQTSQFVLFMTKNWWSLLISFVSLVLLIYACVFLTRKAQ